MDHLAEVREQKAVAEGWVKQPLPGGGWQWFHPAQNRSVHASLDPTGTGDARGALGDLGTTARLAAKRAELEEKAKQKKEEERLARLPPGLRARLEKRGVIAAKKVEDNPPQEGGDVITGGEEGVQQFAPTPPPDPFGGGVSAPPPLGAPAASGVTIGSLGMPSLGPLGMPSLGGAPPDPLRGAASGPPPGAPPRGPPVPPPAPADARSVEDSMPPPNAELPPGWQSARHAGKIYYWNPLTSERQYEHPGLQAASNKRPRDDYDTNLHIANRALYQYEEKTQVTEQDIGKIVGKNGGNVKLLKGALEDAGCKAQIIIPKRGSKPEGKALNGKPVWNIRVQTTVEKWAKKGKRVIDLFMTTGKTFVECVKDCGLNPKMGGGQKKDDWEQNAAPSAGANGAVVAGPAASSDPFDSAGAWERLKRQKKNDTGPVDLMDPSAYSSAPRGGWGAGMDKQSKNAGGDDVDFQQYK